METKKKLHSEEYLNDARNYWWNPDYLNLTAQRFSLHNKKLMLDVGCGVGHWSRILSSFLHSDARIIGVDQEMEWRTL
jgi:2-polyprenyl-3-methyl-5-hydroxy-6-metoxy-1,4-benzoquinol methylase